MRLPENLRKYTERFDAMSLRERALVFLAASVMLVMLADSALFSPILIKQKAYSQKIQQQQEEVRIMQLQLQAYTQAQVSDSAKEKRQRLEKRRIELAALDRDAAKKQRELVTPDRMAQLLADILKRNPDVELVSLRTFAANGLSQVPGGTSGSASDNSPVYRHGVEIVVAGSYLKLLNYVGQLERLPVKLFWGGMDLQSAVYPRVTLTLTLSTLSPEKTWLVI